MHTTRDRRQRLGWQVALLLIDLASAGAAFHIAILVGRGSIPVAEAWVVNAWSGALLAGFWILFSVAHPGFLPRPHRPLITTAHQCFLAVAAGAMACIALLYVFAPGSLAGRMIILPASACMFVLTVITRHAAGRMAPREAFVERYLILGNGDRSRVIADELSDGRHPYKEIVGLVPIEPSDEVPADIPVVGTPASAPRIVREREITHLIVCQPQPLPGPIARSVADCEAAGAYVHTMEATYEALTRRAPVFHVGDDWIADLDSAIGTFYATRVKRALDVILASIGLTLTGPLILLLALIVKLSSKGPAFYVQERVGHDGKPFIFTKLRTMVQNAEADTGPVWARENDPRVTPVGRVLRKCRLDELPQLWNVLRGDMSLVGPRPEREFFVNRFLDEIPLYGKRLLVQPGITGWAQVHHRYDTCHDDVIEKLRWDLFYVKHVSFKLDLLILLKTIGVVLARRGAV